MKTLYHATKKENVFPIMREGIRAGNDGYVYFCETPEECLDYVSLYARYLQCYEYAVIPVYFTDEEVENMGKNIDNSAGLPMAYAFKGSIAADRIPQDLNQISLWKFRKPRSKKKDV
jgi:hypothetical protein